MFLGCCSGRRGIGYATLAVAVLSAGLVIAFSDEDDNDNDSTAAAAFVVLFGGASATGMLSGRSKCGRRSEAGDGDGGEDG